MGDSSECPKEISISSQEEIDNTDFACVLNITLENATGNLTFSTLEYVDNFKVRDSPLLESLSIPNLKKLDEWLDIKNATSLTNISIPHVNEVVVWQLGIDVPLRITRISIIDAPSIEHIVLGNSTTFLGLIIGEPVSTLNEIQMTTAVGELVVDRGCPGLYELEYVRDFQATGWKDCYSTYPNIYTLPKLKSVHNLTLIDSDLQYFDDSVQINGSLAIVETNGWRRPYDGGLDDEDQLEALLIIYSSGGPNILPALITVPGNVTIEAWNDDFNCSKLVDQFENGLIHFLSCNGTDNGTKSVLIVPTESTGISQDNTPSTLSQGAWAGIGVGIGVFAIGMICGIVGLFLRFKRWKKELIERIRQQEAQARQEHLRDSLEMEHEPPNLNLLHESDGTGIMREKPDDHIQEAGGTEVVAEHPDDHIRELPVPPAELPGTTDIKRT
ncbi:hypothetical protein Daesc_001654 [Daldinia eschscholtzii]|uniref:Peptidase A1 domain-containing protein n=1 Tax=Daldinia eschscholtzii TaxID=292717 RepID=A0AAX6MVF0_9PEZI